MIKTMYSAWDALKDFLGALGSVMIAVPWLRDFSLRKRQGAISEVATRGRLAELKGKIETSLREKINSPKAADLVWTVLGLLLICSSFLIALIRGVFFQN